MKVFRTVKRILPDFPSASSKAESQSTFPPEDLPCLFAVIDLERAVATSVSPDTSDSAPLSSSIAPYASHLPPEASVFSSACAPAFSLTSRNDSSPPPSETIHWFSAHEPDSAVFSTYSDTDPASVSSCRTPSSFNEELRSTFDVSPTSSAP